MKIVAQLKLLADNDACVALTETFRVVNAACNEISKIAFEKKKFGKYSLQKLCYKRIRKEYGLTAQAAIHAIRKVVRAYKIDKKKLRVFKQHGALTYDNRILNYNIENRTVSLWTVSGRIKKIPFACGQHQFDLLKYRKGESDLVIAGGIRGGFFLLATCEIDEPTPDETKKILGIDLGIVNLATDSMGQQFSGKSIDESRERNHRIRKELQSKNTRSAKRKLKKLSGKQARFQKNENHRISKQLVAKAKGTSSSIAVEKLTGIRGRKTVRKAERARLGNWGFHQLKTFLTYKAKRLGVAVIEVDPRNTSRTCTECGYCDKKNRKSQSEFVCLQCGHAENADIVGAKNIALRASVTKPIVSSVDAKAEAAKAEPELRRRAVTSPMLLALGS